MQQQKSLIIFILFILCFLFASDIKAQQYKFAKRVGGTQFENAMGIALDSMGNIIVSGYFSGTADFDPGTTNYTLTSNGGNDIFLAKYDSAGNFVWAIHVGGAGEEFNYTDPAVDEYGNIYLCGVFNSNTDFNPKGNAVIATNRGQQDGFVAKYDSTGLLQWVRGVGGALNDDVYRIDYKNYLVLFAGSFADSSYVDDGLTITPLYGSGSADVVFGKFNPNGNLFWLNTLKGNGEDHSYNITAGINGKTYLTGTFEDTLIFDSGGVNPDTLFADGLTAFTASFSNFGNYYWSFPIENAYPFGLKVDHNGDILTCGQFSNFADFDPDADTMTLIAQGSFDGYFAKYTNGGNYVFAKRIGGNGSDICYTIAELSNSSILVSGYFFNTADFDPDVTVASLNSNGFADIYLAHYDSLGNYLSAFGCGSPAFEFCRNMTCNGIDEVFLCGGFEQVVDFNPAPAINTLVSAGSRDGYFVKYAFPTTSVHNMSSADLLIYPNPFVNQINISDNFKQTQLILTDVLGNIIYKAIISAQTKINTELLSPGIYFLTIASGENVSTRKLLKVK
ncbi:MAG TPA: T9SS type A sorting domain-containing protein [Bacteroidia bacterium]|nr:T9SS type A sorting domain-containing protein [Bacteroidia bacterium]